MSKFATLLSSAIFGLSLSSAMFVPTDAEASPCYRLAGRLHCDFQLVPVLKPGKGPCINCGIGKLRERDVVINPGDFQVPVAGRGGFAQR